MVDVHQQYRTLAKKLTWCQNIQTAKEIYQESILLHSPLLACQQDNFGQVSLLQSNKDEHKSQDIQKRAEKR